MDRRAAAAAKGEDIEAICRAILLSRGSMSVAATGRFCNKFLGGLYDHISTALEEVCVLPVLDNAAYDQLLASNIVFLNLVDCAAVN